MPEASLLLLRHFTAQTDGRLCGRTDVPLALVDRFHITYIRTKIGNVDHIPTSPAQRCLQSVEALRPNASDRPSVTHNALLWEQDFGMWESQAWSDIPDLGVLEAEALAQYKDHGGESFCDVVARV